MPHIAKSRHWLVALVACGVVLALALWLGRDDPRDAPRQPGLPQELVVLERREVDSSGTEGAPRSSTRKPRRERSARAGAMDVERIGGSVRDRRGDPLEGALVLLRARRGPLSADLGSTVTQRSGEFTFDLSAWSNEFALRRTLRRTLERDETPSPSELDALAAYGTVSIEIAATLEGLAPATIESTLAELRERPDGLRLQLDDGVELTGYVSRNSPNANWRVAGARVALLDSAGAVAASSSADASGRFVLRAPPDRYDLFVRHEVHGTALLGNVDLRTDGPRPPVAIELRKAGKIAGSVLHADGSPVANLVLEATHSSLLARDSRELSIGEQFELEGPVGLAQALAVTDSDGRFSFDSLCEGRFELRAPGTGDGVLRGPRAVYTDSPDVAYTYRGQRLRVEVSDLEGPNPLDAQLECWRIEHRFQPKPEHELAPHGDGRGTFHLEVAAGERLYLRAFAGGSLFAWTILDVDAGEGERLVQLRVGDSSATPSDGAPGLNYVLGTRVALEVLDETDAPLDGWRATAISEQGDIPTGWGGFKPGADGSLPPLPPGRFRLGLLPARRDSFHCFTTVGSDFEAEVGRPQAVTLRVPLGGRLRLRMPTEARDIDEWQPMVFWDDLPENGWSVEALPLDPKLEPTALLLIAPDRADLAAFSAPPGWEVDAYPPLLPGRWRLRVTRPNSTPRVVEVTVRAGEVTTATP